MEIKFDVQITDSGEREPPNNWSKKEPVWELEGRGADFVSKIDGVIIGEVS